MKKAEEALAQIAAGRLVTRPRSDPIPTVIDGQPSSVRYVEKMSARDIAREALPMVRADILADRAAFEKAEDVLACVDEADISGAIEALAAVRERLGEEKPVT